MPQSPQTSNRLLTSLSRDDFAMLRPHLTQVRLEQGATLQEAEKPIEHVYFPLDGMISMLALFASGEAIEIAAIGREGAIGSKIGLEPQLAFAKAIVQLPGTALRIGIKEFQQAARQSLAITHLASCATDLMTANLQQSAGCNALHHIESRLARWLLHARDRYESDHLPLTQEFLAQMLGVRRTSVSVTAQVLQNAGLIAYRRGKIDITDRAGLEARSCECYGAVRHNVELIIGNAQLAAAAGKN
jgi:CRP-like cAMP-binding protein